MLNNYIFVFLVEKSPTGSLNCLIARSLCNEDPSCFKIINLIPSLCGNEIGKYFVVLLLQLFSCDIFEKSVVLQWCAI